MVFEKNSIASFKEGFYYSKNTTFGPSMIFSPTKSSAETFLSTDVCFYSLSISSILIVTVPLGTDASLPLAL